MIKIVEQSLLYDFYGDLLTKHQKEMYEDVVIHDMSLSEIAHIKGISRQGVHDLIKRCDKILRDYENKLHLVERFMNTKQNILTIRQLVQEFKETADMNLIDEISDISYKILEEI